MTAVHYSDLWQGIAEADPDRPAVLTRDGAMGYGRFAAEAGALASHLQRQGLRVGDAAAMLLYNRPEYLTFLWACLSIGVAPVAINYRYRAAEVRALLEDCDARVLIAPTSLATIVEEATAGLSPAVEVISVSDDAGAIAGATAYDDLVRAGGRMPQRAPSGADMRLYTGGTTGTPKAVVWDMDTLLHARRQSTWGIIGVEPPEGLAEAVAIAVDPGTPRVVTLPLPPLLHGTAQSTTMGTLALGGTIVLQSAAHLDVEEALQLARTHGVTRVIVAGDAVALPFVEAIERSGRPLPRLDSVISSGMRFSDEVKQRLHAQGDLMIVDLLASSEGGPFAFGITRGAEDLPTALVTTPDTVLLDAELNEVAPEAGAMGILAFRGVLPTGYYRDPVKTAATFPVIDGRRYVMPGDWARSRGDGSIELLGRLSAVVNTGGEKVFPAEVEGVLLAHPSVDDAIVFGLPDTRFGEVVSAMVAPAAGATIDPAQLSAHLDAHLAGYKKPRHWFVRASLGRSQTGKVPLAAVKEDAARELASRRTREDAP